jgi:hypothetical protein
MKRFILLFFICVSAGAYGQAGKPHGVNVYFSYGDNQDFKLKSSDGDIGGYKGKYYCGASLEWVQKLSTRWDFCTGLAYTFNRTDYRAGGLSGTPDNLIYTASFRSENLQLFSIPFLFKVHFGNYFFANGGVSLHLINATAFGVGPKIGVGFEYVFDSGLTVSLNPYAEWVISSRHLLHQGARVGIGYRF